MIVAEIAIEIAIAIEKKIKKLMRYRFDRNCSKSQGIHHGQPLCLMQHLSFRKDKEIRWWNRHLACSFRVYGHLHIGQMEAFTLGSSLGRQDACLTMKKDCLEFLGSYF